MSALVEWRVSPNIASTLNAPTQEQWYDFFLAELTTWTGNVNSRWEICSSSKAGNPYYITLKRKAGGNGRVIFIIATGGFTPRTSMNYPGTFVSSNLMYAGFFPDGNLDTPAGFTGSGDFLGNDAGAVGFSGGTNATTSVSTGYILKFFEHEDAFGFAWQNSASTTGANFVAGLIFDDETGAAIQGVHMNQGASYSTSAPAESLSASTTGGMTVISGVKRSAYRSSLFSYLAGALRDLANSRAYFLPVFVSVHEALYAKVAAYKFRQIAQGPATVASVNYQELYITGPTLRAVSLTAQPSAAVASDLWLVNFLT